MADSKRPVVRVQGVSKAYPIYHKPIHRLAELLLPGRRKLHEEFWALKNVDFSIEHGQCIGIVGKNGSGKSTLLQILAGTLIASEGEVEVHGKVAALLELGAGFDPEFTGRENVFNYGMTLGMSRREVEQRYDAIVDFSEIEDFIDQPVKTYSSGMFMRLAFAVAIHVDPELLIVDEALSVGDFKFQQKCLDRFHDFKASGRTIIVVSHSIGVIQNYCDKALWLRKGKAVAFDDAEVVARYYFNDYDEIPQQTAEGVASESSSTAVSEPASEAPSESAASAAGPTPQAAQGVADTAQVPDAGSSALPEFQAEFEDSEIAKTLSFELRGAQDQASTRFQTNDPLVVDWRLELAKPLPAANYGICFESTESGRPIFATSARNDGVDVPPLEGQLHIVFRLPRVQLLRGRYLLRVTVTNERGITMYARVNQVVEYDHPGLEWGVLRLDVEYSADCQAAPAEANDQA